MNRHSGKLDALILDETNSMADISLETGIGCAEDPKNIHGWSLDSRQQFRDEKTNRSIQVISERSYKPIVIYKGDAKESEKVAVQSLSTISSQTEDEEMVFLENKKSKDGRLLWLGICLALLCLILGIVVLYRIRAGGNPATAMIPVFNLLF